MASQFSVQAPPRAMTTRYQPTSPEADLKQLQKDALVSRAAAHLHSPRYIDTVSCNVVAKSCVVWCTKLCSAAAT